MNAKRTKNRINNTLGVENSASERNYDKIDVNNSQLKKETTTSLNNSPELHQRRPIETSRSEIDSDDDELIVLPSGVGDVSEQQSGNLDESDDDELDTPIGCTALTFLEEHDGIFTSNFEKRSDPSTSSYSVDSSSSTVGSLPEKIMYPQIILKNFESYVESPLNENVIEKIIAEILTQVGESFSHSFDTIDIKQMVCGLLDILIKSKTDQEANNWLKKIFTAKYENVIQFFLKLRKEIIKQEAVAFERDIFVSSANSLMKLKRLISGYTSESSCTISDSESDRNSITNNENNITPNLFAQGKQKDNCFQNGIHSSTKSKMESKIEPLLSSERKNMISPSDLTNQTQQDAFEKESCVNLQREMNNKRYTALSNFKAQQESLETRWTNRKVHDMNSFVLSDDESDDYNDVTCSFAIDSEYRADNLWKRNLNYSETENEAQNRNSSIEQSDLSDDARIVFQDMRKLLKLKPRRRKIVASMAKKFSEYKGPVDVDWGHDEIASVNCSKKPTKDNVPRTDKVANKLLELFRKIPTTSASTINRKTEIPNTDEEDSTSSHNGAISPEIYESSNEQEVRSDAPLNPVIKISGTYDQERPRENDHIYDMMEETKVKSSYIKGSVTLPANHVSRKTLTYEEITLPASTPVSLVDLVHKDLVQISSLDKISETGFKGFKTLNMIQTIVFDVAFHTNENMLICAPTGAGKTNIAMLAMMREIKQHVEKNFVDVADFKIIYIAPMKALAAEMANNFSNRLKILKVKVRELTGDMHLTTKEIAETQVLVTTPEKWDVITRKGIGTEESLIPQVKLLIIDEVHLLHSDRGPVIEALVARTLRQVETTQKMIRIVGLSATLPNYRDIAQFLRVNPKVGLFHFDHRFRPVPLDQCFVGVFAKKVAQQNQDMNDICFEKALEVVKKNKQVMVFVHARNATERTAFDLKEIAQKKSLLTSFAADQEIYDTYKRQFSKVRSKALVDLLPHGFGIHHAGLLRSDRSLVENLFLNGAIRVLVTTSTLAWGVNLPANTVIIKGTEYYDQNIGGFVDMGILDVLQIFGRAGRPQFNESGEGVIITPHGKLHHYIALMLNQFPIESKFISHLPDNLNAEISLGTISTIEDAIEWLSYTYLYVRMKLNPMEYGLSYDDIEMDRNLYVKRKELIETTAKMLDKLRMIRFEERSGKLSSTNYGRTASHYYISHNTLETFTSSMKPALDYSQILTIVAQAEEFNQFKVRDEEINDLYELSENYCLHDVPYGPENLYGKINILLQTYIAHGEVKLFSLLSDLAFIDQNITRIVRALFDIAMKENDALMSNRYLTFALMFEKRQWDINTPLRQFNIPGDILVKIEEGNKSVVELREMEETEIGVMLRNRKMAWLVKRCVHEFPLLKLSAVINPITASIMRIRLRLLGDFKWNDRTHGKNPIPYWIWIQDADTNFIHYSEYFQLSRKKVMKEQFEEMVITIPICGTMPSQFIINVPCDRFLGCCSSISLHVDSLIMPQLKSVQTDLLPLQPMSVKALNDPNFEKLYNFSHFNPIQTQLFHCLYHTDNNVLLGAPTGSGKTIVAEIAILRALKQNPEAKVVYIAPLKALVKERVQDWNVRFKKWLKFNVVELTGDVSPDISEISNASIIVTTPEKWDSISRSWQARRYVRLVTLIVIDEIHLLGEERGPVLEVIVSRTNYIYSHTNQRIRIIGLSTALANAQDLAEWLGIKNIGLYNFRPSVRPVPLEVHICAFPEKHYCPRMGTMNKPAFQAIKQYSPTRPTLIFVSSRRQTRLTAMDLMALLASENNPKQWLYLNDERLDEYLDKVKDYNLKTVLAFGIGMHHAGMEESDRKLVEELFQTRRIQVLVATATLAWGVNFPAHLVIIKGTEFFDGKLRRYVDMPITDVLQMMGRAGRPQFDKKGIAVIMVHDIKKDFYKKFLYEPFPVESNLLSVLPDHLNAEIVTGSIRSKSDAVSYLTWTYFYRRLHENPSYYANGVFKQDSADEYLDSVVNSALSALQYSSCIFINEAENEVEPTFLGRIASYYYLRHETIAHLKSSLKPEMSMAELLNVLSYVQEFSDIPVRHNEEIVNKNLAHLCPLRPVPPTFESSHTKTFLLLQAHFQQIEFSITDYYTDLKLVLDQVLRVLQAIIDICGENGWLVSTLRAQQLSQMIIQGHWNHDHPLLTLPVIDKNHLPLFRNARSRRLISLPRLRRDVSARKRMLISLLERDLNPVEIEKIYNYILRLPDIYVNLFLQEEKYSSEEHQRTKIDVNQPVTVQCDTDYLLCVQLKDMCPKRDQRVYAPRFSKTKNESWFINLGIINSKELLSMKRFSFKDRKNISFTFNYTTPKITGIHVLSLYLISDCLFGLDQQYNIKLNVLNESSSYRNDTIHSN